MIAFNLSLSDYAETFLSNRDVSAIYEFQVRLRCRRLCEFAGRELRVDELTCELVNAWLLSAKASGLSPHTLNTYRANVLAVWNEAFRDGLTNTAPLRVRRIKRPQQIVKAYTQDELRKLLTTAAILPGRLSNGNARSLFWPALIHCAYCTGLRRGDLLRLRRDDIGEDGALLVVQRKSNQPVLVRLSAEAVALVSRLHSPEGLALPWGGRLDSLVWAFRRLRTAAGVTRGSFKWIRRSAGSYAESIQPGAGARLLGHRDERMFRRHYEDRAITQHQPPEPPPL